MLNNNRQLDVCAICNEQSEQLVSKTSDKIHYICSICGEYSIFRNAIPILRQSFEENKRLKLSKWVKDKNSEGGVPELTLAKLKNILFNPMEDLENNWGARYERLQQKRYGLIYLLIPRFGYFFMKITLPTKWVKNVDRDGWASNILGVIIWIIVFIMLFALRRH
ncbi:hypothetical protein [Kaarinaea lacus]